MPELPEVETVLRGLAVRLSGQVVQRALLRRPDLRWPVPEGLVRRLVGTRILGFRRRAKTMLMDLNGGDTVLWHLGMSGRVLLEPRDAPEAETLHAHFRLEVEGWRAEFVDPRRFGSLDLWPTGELDSHPRLAGLGPEPLSNEFSEATLSAALAGRHTPIKAALLDQRTVAGLGNIYVSEALWRARISPKRLAASVAGARAARLVPAIRSVLEEAIAAGGSSLRDYRQASGELGYFQHAWRVYGREGEPCEACPGPPSCPGIVRIVQGTRATFYCPRLQR